MKWSDLRLRLRALIFRKEVEKELEDELGFHLEMQRRKNLDCDMNADEARRQAAIRFGSVQTVAEEIRDERRLNLIDTIIQDLRYAGRQLRRSPAFTIAAVLSLSIGIGANSAIFRVLDAVVLQPLPVRD